jgi:hypothetical protein
MKRQRTNFDTSSQMTKKKRVRDINAEPEMIELKLMIRDGKLGELKVIYGLMTDLEKERTRKHLKMEATPTGE